MPAPESCQNDQMNTQPQRPGSRLVATALLAALAAAISLPASAQNRALQRQLQNADRVDCTFSTLVTGDWEDNETTAAAEPTELTAAFVDILLDEGTAEAEGRFGASFIVVRQSQTYLHFMQMLRSGPLYLTTVLAEEASEGKMKAIHTRHEFSPTKVPGFTSRPEMYLGECAVTERPAE